MRHVLAVALVLCALLPPRSAAAQSTLPPVWAKADAIYVNTGPPRQWQGPVRATNCDWDGKACTDAGPASGTWATVDLSASPWSIPENAVAAQLSGILVITQGTKVEIADLGVIFRAPGSTTVKCDTDNYMGQAVEASVGNGIRSGMATWVPVVDGKIEYCWYRSTPGTYPANSAYAVNLSIQAVAVGSTSSALAKSASKSPSLGTFGLVAMPQAGVKDAPARLGTPPILRRAAKARTTPSACSKLLGPLCPQ